MQSARQLIMVRPGEGKRFSDGLICRVTSESTNGEYCAFEVETPPGEGVRLHVHSNEDELYYILEGTYEVQCGEKIFTAETGAMAVLPRNIPHAFRNSRKTPARALTVFIPGGFDLLVEELDSMSPEDASDKEKHDAILNKYGIRMVEN